VSSAFRGKTFMKPRKVITCSLLDSFGWPAVGEGYIQCVLCVSQRTNNGWLCVALALSEPIAMLARPVLSKLATTFRRQDEGGR
jgi:hypothetical protein